MCSFSCALKTGRPWAPPPTALVAACDWSAKRGKEVAWFCDVEMLSVSLASVNNKSQNFFWLDAVSGVAVVVNLAVAYLLVVGYLAIFQLLFLALAKRDHLP